MPPLGGGEKVEMLTIGLIFDLQQWFSYILWLSKWLYISGPPRPPPMYCDRPCEFHAEIIDFLQKKILYLKLHQKLGIYMGDTW